MNVLKKKTIATATCCMIFGVSMVFSPVVANSADPGVEELMAEGISFPSHPESNRRYCGDKSIPSTEEMMGEGIAVPQAEVKKNMYMTHLRLLPVRCCLKGFV